MFKHAIVVGSGKGGVGKSTVAVNLAIVLAKLGLKVGLLDADIYGPSIPIMLGLRNLTPRIQRSQEGAETVLPFCKYGLQILSMGFFMEEARSLSWRGPMLHGALHKMLASASWGELDLLLIDLPPGTGDVPISLAQLIPLHGALVVTTPQEVAMLDAIKAINLYHQLDIPLMGIIENMAGFLAPDTGKLHHIFGTGKAQELAERFGVPLLGTIPLIPEIRIGGDEGRPAACSQDATGAYEAFYALGQALEAILMTLKS